MKTIKQIEREIAILRSELIDTLGQETREEIEEQIQELEWDIDEIVEAENEQHDYEEMTGTTPQDRYLEQNHYAIVQSEAYDRFRREY